MKCLECNQKAGFVVETLAGPDWACCSEHKPRVRRGEYFGLEERVVRPMAVRLSHNRSYRLLGSLGDPGGCAACGGGRFLGFEVAAQDPELPQGYVRWGWLCYSCGVARGGRAKWSMKDPEQPTWVESRQMGLALVGCAVCGGVLSSYLDKHASTWVGGESVCAHPECVHN